MEQAISSLLAGWENFYVIVGSASAALIGLQFVVMVLSAETEAGRSESTTGAFATPTIFHFSAVLFIAAVLSAPWPTLIGADLALGTAGVVGVVYATLVVRHTRRQTDYRPVLEDWIWHCALPLAAYALLLAAALLLPSQHVLSMFLIGGLTLMLLFIGIHNAWDSVVFVAMRRQQRRRAEREQDA